MKKNLHRLAIKVEMLSLEIDEQDIETNESTVKLKDRLDNINEILLPIIDTFYKNKKISRSTFHKECQNKFEYIFNREFKRINTYE